MALGLVYDRGREREREREREEKEGKKESECARSINAGDAPAG